MSKEKMEKLLVEIEIMRCQLHDMIQAKDILRTELLINDEVLSKSKKLDALLNEYHRLFHKKP